MTACTNKARGAVVAALAGALALGAAPAVALAANAGADLLVSDQATAFSNGTLTLQTDGDLSAGAEKGEYAATADGEALEVVAKSVTLGDDTVVNISGSDDYELVFYKADKDGKRIGSELDEVVDAGSYVVVLRAVAGDYEGGEAEAILTVSTKSFDDVTFGSAYVIDPEDASDTSRTPVYTGSELNIGISPSETSSDEKLVEGEDYEIKILHSGDSADDPEVDVVDAVDEDGNPIQYVAYVTGINEYAGQVKQINFNVEQFDLTNAEAEVADVIAGGVPSTVSRVIDKAGNELDTDLVELTVSGVWGQNKEYNYTVTPKKSVGGNVIGSYSGKVQKFGAAATFKYDGKELGSTLAFDKNEESFDSDKLEVFAGDEEIPSSALTITYRNSKGVKVTKSDVETYAGVYEVTVSVDGAKAGYEYGGSKTFTVKSVWGSIDADASIYVSYDGKIVTSIEKSYDGEPIKLNDNLKVTVKDSKGNVVNPSNGANYTVTIVDADGKDVTDEATSTGLVNAGTYTLKFETEKYDVTGTTELPITINKADLTELTLGAFVDYKGSKYIDSNQKYSLNSDLKPEFNTHEVGADGNETWNLVTNVMGSDWNATLERYDTEKGEWVSADPSKFSDYVTADSTVVKYRLTIKSTDDLSKNFEFATEDGTTLEFVVADGSKANSWFDDVVPTDVFFNAINWMSTHKAGGAAASGDETALIEGYAGANVFGQGNSITRADVAVILFRMAGGTAGTDVDFKFDENGGYVTGFSDVDGDGVNMYYDQAIAWANATGVVHGYDDGTFGASDFITREQLATMLANYAKVVDRADVELDEDALASMPDGDQVSEYAEKAVSWCVANGLMGNGGSISPLAEITRGETAAMGYNYLTKLVLK